MKMTAALDRGKQVMIFVTSRADTVKTLESMLDLAAKQCMTDLFSNSGHEQYAHFKQRVDKSRSRELQRLFASAMGIHHAGLLRADRSLTEQMFESGVIRVLCCTATLAWGVNLPAHTVIVKGTEIYDPERGGFVDMSVLDILQIFGRAGRPQYDVEGHAVLLTHQKSLTHYLGLLTQQTPIESNMIKALADHLNAEIVNGTVNNIREAVTWLSYTFLFVRMKANPLAYGMRLEEVLEDPQLQQKRLTLVKEAADTLDSCMMARYDRRSGNLAVTDLGRIASHYYLKHDSIDIFNRMLSPHLLPREALHLVCVSSEFDQLKCRPEELVEIEQLRKQAFLPVQGCAEDTACKVNLLLQNYLSLGRLTAFTLQSDSNYIAQNGSRITRALFEWCLRRGWASLARFYLVLSLAIDRRCRFDLSPLRQFGCDSRFSLPEDVYRQLEQSQLSLDELCEMSARELGQLVRNMRSGGAVQHLLGRVPRLRVDSAVQPITPGIVRLTLTVSALFEWDDRLHEQLLLARKMCKEAKVLEITLPVPHNGPVPRQYFIRAMSDNWVGCEVLVPVPFDKLRMPRGDESEGPAHTDLLPLHPIPKQALNSSLFESLYSFDYFNAVQSQAFHTLFHTDRNVLIGAPTGRCRCFPPYYVFSLTCPPSASYRLGQDYLCGAGHPAPTAHSRQRGAGQQDSLRGPAEGPGQGAPEGLEGASGRATGAVDSGADRRAYPRSGCAELGGRADRDPGEVGRHLQAVASAPVRDACGPDGHRRGALAGRGAGRGARGAGEPHALHLCADKPAHPLPRPVHCPGEREGLGRLARGAPQQ
ncbi:MAG: hypothetical protein EOO70_05830 [Myxococcaceae bacterium]|nr:MAG: hypothetical protein EOO70_05830 [Myxococcaceae bacterium]